MRLNTCVKTEEDNERQVGRHRQILKMVVAFSDESKGDTVGDQPCGFIMTGEQDNNIPVRPVVNLLTYSGA